MNLSQVFESVARRQPDKAAIITPTARISYSELADTVDRFTGALLSRGLSQGNLVAAILGNTPDHLALLLAARGIGLTIMAVDTNWTAHEIGAVLDRFQPAVTFVDELTVAKVPGRNATEVRTLAEGLPYKGASLSTPDDVAAFLMLSSGTTGLSKGAEVSAGAMAFRFLAQVVVFGLSSDDVYLNCMSLQAGGGRSFSLSHLYLGGTVVLPPKFIAAEVDVLVRKHAVTNSMMVPTMLHRLLDLPTTEGWPSVRMLLSSGSRLASPEREGIRTRFTSHLWDYYASVEAGGISIQRPEDIGIKPESVGRPMWGTDVVIRDGDRMLQVGDIGDIYYRSPGMASGYRGGDSSAFRDGWYWTGDVGFLDSDGFLTMTGRSKEMIVTGGVNVYPAEIEVALTAFEGIKRAVAVGIPDEEWGERVVAVVEASHSPNPDALTDHLRHLLAGPKRPKAVYLMDSIPITSADKIDRQAVVSRILTQAPIQLV